MNDLRRTATVAVLLSLFAVLAGWSQTADAIPAFSRKYATSCSTCHVAFPKLNAFGKAYRNNGYRMPGGDEDLLKDANIKLGASPWKRLWPDAIWPSDIPYNVPISLLALSEFQYSPNEEVKTDFQTPSDISILTAGTLGESLSWYGRINLIAPGEGVHLHQFFAQFNRLAKSSLLNVRVGQFEPRAVPFTAVQRLAKTPYLMNVTSMPLDTWVDYLADLPSPHDEGLGGLMRRTGDGDGGHDEGGGSVLPGLIGAGHGHSGAFTMATTQLGLELWGAKSGMGGYGGFEYALGVVNGNGTGQDPADAGSVDNNSAKDFYWRASYKFGGMSVMGDPETTPSGMHNWVDNSVRVGVFGYHGKAPFLLGVAPPDEHADGRFAAGTLDEDPGHDAPTAGVLTEERYQRLGVDVDIWYGDLNLFGAYMKGKTRMNPSLAGITEVDYTSMLAQADYMVYPWLVTSLRYERADYNEAFGKVERWVPHVTALLRANVKFLLEAALYTGDSADQFPTRYRFSFDFGF